MTNKKYLTKEQIDEITNSIPELRDKAILQTAYFGGLRLYELMELRRGDIKFGEETVKISLQDREITLVEPRKTMERYIDSYGISDNMERLWQTKKRDRLPRNYFNKIIEVAGETTRSEVNYNLLRQSRAIEMSENHTEMMIVSYFGWEERTAKKYRYIAQNKILDPLGGLFDE